MRRLAARREDGASAVEFSFIAILLLMLVFGIVEAGWAFSQQIEIRHGAREGARLVAVNHPGGDTVVTAAVCDRMHFSGDRTATSVEVNLAGSSIGDTASVEVSTPYQGLTGFLDQFFGAATIASVVEIRLEQVADPSLGTATPIACPPP